MIEEFINSHTKKQLLGMQMFLTTDENGFVLTGQSSSWKTFILNKLIQTPLNAETLFFKFNCFHSTTLDDLLLFIFDKFKTYFKSQNLIPPKPQSKAISDDINIFIKFVNKPFVFILDSFENIKDTTVQNDIVQFLKHISSFQDAKFIITANKAINEGLLTELNTLSSQIKKMDSDVFYEYTFELGLDDDEESLTELFKLSKEQFLPVQLTSKLVKILNISLSDFLKSYTKHENEFNKFLISKLISLIPEKYFALIWFFAICRCGLNIECINTLKMIDKKELDYLINRSVLTFENGLYFMREDLKASVSEKASSETLEKIHSFLISFYEQKLAQKPFERGILISRTSARAEIAYHTNFYKSIKKEPLKTSTTKVQKETQMSYVSYSKGANFDWTNIEIQKDNTEEKNKQRTSNSDNENKEEAPTNIANTDEIKAFGLTQQELKLLNITEKSMSEPTQEKTENIPEIQPKQTLDDYLNTASNYEEQFQYTSAIISYNKALEDRTDEMYEVKQPLILTKLGLCHKKAGNFEKSIETFNKALALYIQTGENIKANYIKLNIAKMYVENYKIANAKEVYESILEDSKANPNQLNMSCYLALGEIEDNLSNTLKAKSFYEKALQFASSDIQDELSLAQIHFKYALILDDMLQTEEAVTHYLKCIEILPSSNENIYLPLAYSNLASISQEQKDLQKAIEYYMLALKIDEEKKNYEGQYFIYSKLGSLYAKTDKELALKMLFASLKNAKKLNDYFYTASAYTALGDFYYTKKLDEKALKSYIFAKKILEESNDNANSEKLITRIADLKARMSIEAFERIMEGLGD